MLVIVAQNGADDKPDPKTLEAFIMPTSMGISYKAGVWRELQSGALCTRWVRTAMSRTDAQTTRC